MKEDDIIDMISHYRLKIGNLHFNESRNGKIIRNNDECSAMADLLLDIISDLNGKIIVSSLDLIYKDLIIKLLKRIKH